MELNNNRARLTGDRYTEVQRASESRKAEINATVDRVQRTIAERHDATSRIGQSTDSIELSGAPAGVQQDAGSDREQRVEGLRAAVENGTLFNTDRLARAAERLLTPQ